MTANDFTCCSQCGQSKPASDFHKDKSKRTGRRSKCKSCIRAYNDTRRERNAAAARRWNKANPDKVRQNNAMYRAKHPERVRERERRKLEVRSKDEKNAAMRRYRQLHPEKLRAQGRARYAANTAMFKEVARRWRQHNPDKQRHYKAQRKARLYNAEGSHTLQQWQELCASFGFCCAQCGADDRELTRDHMQPLSRGGSDWIDNIQPLCVSCNSRKSTRTYEEYMEYLAEHS